MHHNPTNLTFATVSIEDLGAVAKDIVKKARHITVWFFYGGMGAGKTTFIKSIARELGAEDVVSSPTFAIVNEYALKDADKIYHFDFYRLKNENEAYDIGVEEYFYSNQYCLVEWPEKIPSFIPAKRVDITINTEDTNHRTIAISLHDGEEKNRV